MRNYDWLNKKTPRAVDQLRLWPDNPRLNPEENHISLTDYAEDFTYETADRTDFFLLIKSIVDDGFIPADPIVVWKNEENERYYVAEGNRRVVALKLLREPHKAPQSIRSFIRANAAKINKDDIEKISVNVAPSFEEAEWYINQRNSTSSLQRKWTRIQQQRWLAELYEKYEGDIAKITSITKLSRADLEEFIRVLKIKDFVRENEVRSNLTAEEFEKANSYRFPITILERFFQSKEVRERWGVEFNGIDVIINSNLSSFYTAYTALIKRIIDRDAEIKIDTRTITTNLNQILDSLPQVIFDQETEGPSADPPEQNNGTEENQPGDTETPQTPITEASPIPDQTIITPAPPTSNTGSVPRNNLLKGDPNRVKMVLPIYHLHTDSYRLAGLFSEFKSIPYGYKNNIAAGLRVFLDLAVLKYIETEALEADLRSAYRMQLRDIYLSRRIEYIKANKLTGRTQNIAARLIDPTSEYSLDVLNGYIHGTDTHYLSKQFLNRFWDFLFPLFQELLDIREVNA